MSLQKEDRLKLKEYKEYLERLDNIERFFRKKRMQGVSFSTLSSMALSKGIAITLPQLFQDKHPVALADYTHRDYGFYIAFNEDKTVKEFVFEVKPHAWMSAK